MLETRPGRVLRWEEGLPLAGASQLQALSVQVGNIKVHLNSCCLLLEDKGSARWGRVGLVPVRARPGCVRRSGFPERC